MFKYFRPRHIPIVSRKQEDMLRLWTLALLCGSSSAFSPSIHKKFEPLHASRSVLLRMSESTKNNEYLQKMSEQNREMASEPQMNPNRPELPVIPGDYDWDMKYQGDPDWIKNGGEAFERPVALLLSPCFQPPPWTLTTSGRKPCPLGPA